MTKTSTHCDALINPPSALYACSIPSRLHNHPQLPPSFSTFSPSWKTRLPSSLTVDSLLSLCKYSALFYAASPASSSCIPWRPILLLDQSKHGFSRLGSQWSHFLLAWSGRSGSWVGFFFSVADLWGTFRTNDHDRLPKSLRTLPNWDTYICLVPGCSYRSTAAATLQIHYDDGIHIFSSLADSAIMVKHSQHEHASPDVTQDSVDSEYLYGSHHDPSDHDNTLAKQSNSQRNIKIGGSSESYENQSSSRGNIQVFTTMKEGSQTSADDYSTTIPASSSNKREKEWFCQHEDCGATFFRESDLTRHARKHKPPMLHCLAHGCPYRNAKGFYRWDKLIGHQLTKHSLGLKDVPWGYMVEGTNGIEAVPCSVNKLNWNDRRYIRDNVRSGRKLYFKKADGWFFNHGLFPRFIEGANGSLVPNPPYQGSW